MLSDKIKISLIILASAAISVAASLFIMLYCARNYADKIGFGSNPDPEWENWKLRGYPGGYDIDKAPLPITFKGPISTDSAITVRSEDLSGRRWKFHIFEGYAKDGLSRLTMILNKHEEFGKPVAEIYYYSSVYGETDDAYNWIRIGSDVGGRAFLFSRDKAVFFGELKLENVITLGDFGLEDMKNLATKEEELENSEATAKNAKLSALKSAKDGAMFFDRDNRIVVIKIGGKWMRLAVEDLPQNVKYPF